MEKKSARSQKSHRPDEIREERLANVEGSSGYAVAFKEDPPYPPDSSSPTEP